MKRIALYGGAFDPPHLGHVLVMTSVLNAGAVDELWVVPTGAAREKSAQASPQDREAMLTLTLETLFDVRAPIRLDDTQLHWPWYHGTTVDLVTACERRYPDEVFSFVIGADLLADIPAWHRAAVLMERRGFFLVVPRPGQALPASLPPYATLIPALDAVVTDISSSLVRSLLAENRSVVGLVPAAVLRYIERHRLYRPTPAAITPAPSTVLGEGQFLRLRRHKGWEFVERTNCTGVVLIVAVTEAGAVILTEQFRMPVGRCVIAWPAGLVNDTGTVGEETWETAARRELLEETGYLAREIVCVTRGPTSSGLSAEVVLLCRARQLQKLSSGGGDATEAIRVHEVPLDTMAPWLRAQEQVGHLIDPKVYAGLYFLQERPVFSAVPSVGACHEDPSRPCRL